MTDEEREDLNTFKHDLVKQARWWQWKAETLEKENECLKAENAALREQISKMIMPPCTLGDTLHLISFYFGDGYDERGKQYIKSVGKLPKRKLTKRTFTACATL